MTPHNAASHLGLFCLPMFHKKDDRLKWVNDSKFNGIQTLVDSADQDQTVSREAI